MRKSKKFYNASNDYFFRNLFYNYNFLSILLDDLFGVSINNFKYSNASLPKENKEKSNGECDFILENEEKNIIGNCLHPIKAHNERTK